MNDIYEIIGKILAATFIAFVAYFCKNIIPSMKEWLHSHTEKSDLEALETIITSFVQAAEQLYYDSDGTGEVRMDYVKSQLSALGYEITNEIVSMIEGAVWKINTENRKVGPKTNQYEYIENGSEYDYNQEGVDDE